LTNNFKWQQSLRSCLNSKRTTLKNASKLKLESKYGEWFFGNLKIIFNKENIPAALRNNSLFSDGGGPMASWRLVEKMITFKGGSKNWSDGKAAYSNNG
jgi:hypothetical protein